MTTSRTAGNLMERKVMLRIVSPIERDARAESELAQHEERQWLEALERGEEAAVARLYNEHHQAVRAFVRRLLSSSAEVEDLVHDVFVAAPTAFRNYRGDGSVRSFLFSMAVHHVSHHLRASTRRRTWLDRFRFAPVHPPAPTTPEAHSQRRELAERLQRALETLSFDHRTAIVLCEVEDLSSVEAAGVLGVPEGTVRTRLHHAKKKLRAIFEEEESQ